MRAPTCSLILFAAAGTLAASAQSVPLHVDADASHHRIDPNIYGIVSYGLDPKFAKEIKVPHVRWGGDGTSQYNWQVDSSNAGFDWFFMGGSGVANPAPSASADTMVRTFKAAGAGSLITIPMLPYVNKSAAWSCSFPVSAYGAQQWTNPYEHPNGSACGNSITATGDQLVDSAVLSNHVENSTTLQMGWVQHLTNTFGAARDGGVAYYQLDNEPSGWNNTHRDVHPERATYASIVALGQKYATAVKAVDPTAKVMGPSDFSLGGWVGTPAEQNNQLAGQFYLKQMAAADAATHRRTLDYFDEHYYFQFSNPAEQLASTRTLWDSTYNGGTWVEQWSFQGPMQLIPRFKGWIAANYPGTKLALSEYSIDSGNKQVTDALAEADVLGIFGREGVDFANMWNAPLPTDPIAYAFRLFRNYDGAGAQFGDTGVQATSADQARLAVYAAERGTDGVLTIVVLNKSAGSIQSTLTLDNFSSASMVGAYRYSGADLTHIVRLSPVPNLAKSTLSTSFPAYSATIFALTGKIVTPPTLPFRPCARTHIANLRPCATSTHAAAEANLPSERTVATHGFVLNTR